MVDVAAKLKQSIVSQVLEIGIIFHSVMSQNKCSIGPLVAALAFHQIFEGMGLSVCIAQVMALETWPTLSDVQRAKSAEGSAISSLPATGKENSAQAATKPQGTMLKIIVAAAKREKKTPPTSIGSATSECWPRTLLHWCASFADREFVPFFSC